MAAYTAYTEALREGRRTEGVESAAADRDRNDRARREWQVAGAQRAVRRVQGAARRLLPHRGAGPRCGDHLGGALPGRRATASSRCGPFGACEPRDATPPMSASRGRTGGDERARSTADAVARRSYGKLVAFLAARIARRRGRGGRAVGGVRVRARGLAARTAARSNPEAWLLTAARRKLIDFARRRRSGANAAGELRVLAEQLEVESEGAGERGDSRSAPRVDVRVRASRDRSGNSRAADAAGRARPRRRRDRFRVPAVACGDGPAARAREDQDSRGRASRSGFPRTTSCPIGSGPCSTRSTPRSPKAGATRAVRTSRGAISPRRRSSSAGS